MNVLTLEWLRTVCGCMMVGRKGGAHTIELMDKTQEFIDCAFTLSNNRGVKCPRSKCRNIICEDKRTLTLHLCKVGFTSGYEVWTHHGESVHQTVSVVEENDRTCNDRMNEMIDAIRPELERNPEDPSTPKVQKFFDILRASQESLREQLYSQSVTDRLVSWYHFLIFYTIFLSNLHCWCFLQNQYGQEMVRRNREQIDWRKANVDPMALYASGGRKSHGR
jgi:hypothetical protein